MKESIKELVSKMTIEEKASLCSGKNFWTLQDIERLGIPSIMVTDGPHGLRKQDMSADHLGLNSSVKSTCFPPACLTGSGWDMDNLYTVGQAIAEEAAQENVAVVLGPGVNIKRSPLCGRNFEYFSEDPYLSGECGVAWVKGVESKGIGSSVKHYTANNQEDRRMTGNSVVDLRALRDIYMSPFEAVVRRAKPATVMCSYNKINGEYGCQNEYTLNTCLRSEWGFEGLVVTDWGAMDERVQALKAGLELEMPGKNSFNDTLIVEAVKNGSLKEDVLNNAVEKILELTFRKHTAKGSYDAKEHNELARKVAANSMVLLQNKDGILPLKKSVKCALIGDFAAEARYQGAGSSKINPTMKDSIEQEFSSQGIEFSYSKGYDRDSDEVDHELIAQAVKTAKDAEVVVLVVGLPDAYESEGYDRKHLNMPPSHNTLVEEVSKVNENIVVVIYAGSPVMMPWKDKIKSILLAYLPGQAPGGSVVDVLSGKVNPSGKLAETFPLCLEDTPCYKHYGIDCDDIEYRESVFVGYRYYDWAKKEVLFPFGFGLSYTNFEYKNMTLSWDNAKQTGEVCVEVTNVGNADGSEVVQLYVGMENSAVMRAPRELRGFCKKFIKAGETVVVTIPLNRDSFKTYSVEHNAFEVEKGCYNLSLAASSRDIKFTQSIDVDGVKFASLHKYNPDEVIKDGILDVSRDEFVKVYGCELPLTAKAEKLHINSRLVTVLATKGGSQVFSEIKKSVEAMFSDGSDMSRMMLAMVNDMPMRSLSMFSGGQLNRGIIIAMIEQANSINNA